MGLSFGLQQQLGFLMQGNQMLMALFVYDIENSNDNDVYIAKEIKPEVDSTVEFDA